MFLVLVGEEKGEGVYFHFQDKVREAAFVLAGNSRTNGCCALLKSFQNKKGCPVAAASVHQKLTCCCSKLYIGGTSEPGSKNRAGLGVIASFKVIVVQNYMFSKKISDCTKSFKRATI